jgi:gentisate 1,2-dioxygenase
MYNEANGPSMSQINKEKEVLIAKLPEQQVQPLWKVMHAMVPPTPKPQAQVTLWRYKELRPLLLEAGRLVSSEEAERRVLMLVNPALS